MLLTAEDFRGEDEPVPCCRRERGRGKRPPQRDGPRAAAANPHRSSQLGQDAPDESPRGGTPPELVKTLPSVSSQVAGELRFAKGACQIGSMSSNSMRRAIVAWDDSSPSRLSEGARTAAESNCASVPKSSRNEKQSENRKKGVSVLCGPRRLPGRRSLRGNRACDCGCRVSPGQAGVLPASHDDTICAGRVAARRLVPRKRFLSELLPGGSRINLPTG